MHTERLAVPTTGGCRSHRKMLGLQLEAPVPKEEQRAWSPFCGQCAEAGRHVQRPQDLPQDWTGVWPSHHQSPGPPVLPPYTPARGCPHSREMETPPAVAVHTAPEMETPPAVTVHTAQRWRRPQLWLDPRAMQCGSTLGEESLDPQGFLGVATGPGFPASVSWGSWHSPSSSCDASQESGLPRSSW